MAFIYLTGAKEAYIFSDAEIYNGIVVNVVETKAEIDDKIID